MKRKEARHWRKSARLFARDRRERLVAWTVASDSLGGSHDESPDRSQLIVATSHALYPRPDDRLPWDDIVRGVWQTPTLTLTTVRHEAPEEISMLIMDPRGVPDAVLDRVNHTILVTSYEQLTTDVGALFVARRSEGAGTSGARWTVVFDRGADARDPELSSLAQQALRRMRESFGI